MLAVFSVEPVKQALLSEVSELQPCSSNSVCECVCTCVCVCVCACVHAHACLCVRLGEGYVYLRHRVQTIMVGLELWSQILYVQSFRDYYFLGL